MKFSKEEIDNVLIDFHDGNFRKIPIPFLLFVVEADIFRLIHMSKHLN